LSFIILVRAIKMNTTSSFNTMYYNVTDTNMMGELANLQEERLSANFTATLAGRNIGCMLSLKHSWALQVTFAYHGNAYAIDVTSNNASFIKCLKYYIQQTGDVVYGILDEATQGVLTSTAQRDGFSRVLAAHAMSCLDAVVVTQGRHVLDYAVWYRERTVPDTYSSLIQKMICHFIVNEDFISGTASYEVTPWAPNQLPL
jgi:hypothetical protein